MENVIRKEIYLYKEELKALAAGYTIHPNGTINGKKVILHITAEPLDDITVLGV